MNNLFFHQEPINQIQIHNIAYHVGQERTLLINQHLVRIVLLDKWHRMEHHHVPHVPLEKHPTVIKVIVNNVTQDSSPAQEYPVFLALPARSLQSLEQHHALPVLLGSTANLIKAVVWLVLQEHIPQTLDPKIVNNVQKVPIHHLDQQIALHVLKEAMPVVKQILSVPCVKPESTLLVLDPHLALTVMQVVHPFKDPYNAYYVMKVPLLPILDQVVVQYVQLVNLAIVLDKLVVLTVRLAVHQVQVPLLAQNVLLVLMHLVQHHPHVASALLEHILPILEQLVVILVMQDTILMLEKLSAQLANKVITLQVQELLLAPHVLQAITPLLPDPQGVKSVLRVLSLQLDQVAVLNVHLEPMQRNLEVLNVLIVQLGDIHQEMDQQAVKCVL